MNGKNGINLFILNRIKIRMSLNQPAEAGTTLKAFDDNVRKELTKSSLLLNSHH
jgi:hypothetical protein